ncbi:hypothetical protein [Propionispora hippei]|uniref:Uncharacterized protein n=1 Tax=Propionispora hippei DSM 15287 TaxID=1123003 RepID=A0A1M6LFS7_9FIRM|nr:hypothetical protein [Propionispora hippei]SHJ69978.1 hypothetical protein SAMN02745170_03115 [Propionispora hippei DSM 15287]
MGKFSQEVIDEIQCICDQINSEDIPTGEKQQLYQRLELIYEQYFDEIKRNMAAALKKQL